MPSRFVDSPGEGNENVKTSPLVERAAKVESQEVTL